MVSTKATVNWSEAMPLETAWCYAVRIELTRVRARGRDYQVIQQVDSINKGLKARQVK